MVGPASPLFDWVAGLIRTAAQHRLLYEVCGQVSTGSATTQLSAMRRGPQSQTQRRGSRFLRKGPKKCPSTHRHNAVLVPAQTPTDSPSAPALTAPPMCGSPRRRLDPRAWTLRSPVASVQRPGTQSGMTTTQNLSEYETLKRAQSGISGFDGLAGG